MGLQVFYKYDKEPLETLYPFLHGVYVTALIVINIFCGLKTFNAFTYKL